MSSPNLSSFLEAEKSLLQGAVEVRSVSCRRKYSEDREGFHSLTKALAKNNSCESLWLSWNGINAEGARSLAAALVENSRLEKLNLSTNQIGTEGATAIVNALKSNSSLRQLNLHNNGIDPTFDSVLADVLKVNRGLVKLHLGQNFYGHKSMLLLAQSLKLNETLQGLYLSTCSIRSDGAKSLAEGLKVNHTLNELVLSYNGINFEGARALAKALKVNTGLQEFSIAGNRIGPKGARYFAKALKVNTTLQHLTLSGNKIKDVGTKAIAAALKKNKTLLVLNIHFNMIRLDGARAIASSLKVNKTLETLIVTDNDLGKESGVEFSQALMENNTLRNLRILFSNIGAEGIQEIAKALSVNSTLNSLGYCDMVLKDNEASILKDALERNPNSSLIDFKTNCISPTLQDEIHTLVRKNFHRTLNSDRKAEIKRIRLMIVGQGKAGKSATVRSLLGKSFNPNWDSTVGADVQEGVVLKNLWTRQKLQSDQAARFAVRLMKQKLPTRNAQKNRSAKSRLTWKRSHTDERSQSLINTDSAKGETFAVDTVEIEGENVSLPPSVPSDEEYIERDPLLNTFSVFGDNGSVSELERQYDSDFILQTTDAVDALTLSIWDFGGQEVFYTMHHIFLTSSGIYLLAFDSRSLLDPVASEDAKQYILFWLRSISLHAPNASILLVGTFAADVKGNFAVLDKILNSFIKDRFPQLLRSSCDYFFPIDNKDLLGIADLRLAIKNCAVTDSALKQEVSMRWMSLLDSIIEKSKDQPYLSFSNQVCNMAADVGILKQSEIIEAMSFFHERGFVIYLDSTAILSEIIVTNPQWLVDMLSKVIRDDSFHITAGDFKQSGLEAEAKRAFSTGEVSLDLLEEVWKGQPIDFLIDLMKRTMLMSEWRKGNSYLVPSLLRRGKYKAPSDLEYCNCLKFDFTETFLAFGVFQRVVCLCVEYLFQKSKLDEHEIEVGPDFASFLFEKDFKVHLLNEQSSQCIFVYAQGPKLFSTFLKILHSMLSKVNADVMHGKLKWTVQLRRIKETEFLSLDIARSQQVPGVYVPTFEDQERLVAVDLDSFLEGL